MTLPPTVRLHDARGTQLLLMSIHRKPNVTTYVIKCGKSRAKRRAVDFEEFREWEIGFRTSG